jgi:hypothetical protein
MLAYARTESGGFVELQPHWAANIVIGQGRLAGRTVGVIANDPLRKGGCPDSLSAEKASRFVRTCDALQRRNVGKTGSMSSRVMSKSTERKHRGRARHSWRWGIPVYGVSGPPGK